MASRAASLTLPLACRGVATEDPVLEGRIIGWIFVWTLNKKDVHTRDGTEKHGQQNLYFLLTYTLMLWMNKNKKI
jgi:hypothetical protein